MSYGIDIQLHESLLDEERTSVDVQSLASMIAWVFLGEDVDEDTGVTVLLGGDELLRGLNKQHRDIDEPTDVLSFPASEGETFPGEPGPSAYLGDIAVSVPMVYRQAAAASIERDEELRHIVLHGLLHLLGHDHQTLIDDARMQAREEAILGAGFHARRTGEPHGH